MKNIDILNKLSEGNTSDWLEKAEWRKQNKSWLDTSAEIALKIISELKRQGKTKRELANEMGVSPQNISKLLSGSANFCLETISKFERILNINLIKVTDNQVLENDFRNEVTMNFIFKSEEVGTSYINMILPNDNCCLFKA